MTPAAFRSHLATMCWTQRGFAALLDLPHNTVHRWANGQATIPPHVAKWLTDLVQHMAWWPPPR